MTDVTPSILEPLPSWWWLLSLGLGLPALPLAWAISGNEAAAFVASLSISIVVFCSGMFRRHYNKVSFWLCIVTLLVAHIFLVKQVDFTVTHRAKTVVLPFALLDAGCTMLSMYIFIAVGKWVGGRLQRHLD